MKGINKAIIIGHLGADPEVRYTASSKAITNIRVATSEKWKDKQTGEAKEETQWHRIVFFGKLAEIAGEYLKKGSLVYIEGKIVTRKWQDKDGQDRYSTEIVVDGFNGVMQMLGGRSDDQGASGGQQQGFRDKPKAPKQEEPADEFDDEDIPF